MGFFSRDIVVILLLSIVVLCYGDNGYTRATYYGSPECLGNPSGACGYGEYGKTVNNGQVTGVSRLYRNGTGCGACYQVRCKIPTHCTDEGTKVAVTDFGIGHHTDFILSVRAYSNLARPNMAEELFAYGVIDVEYRRVPCTYNSNILLKVHERSYFPSYLAILALYQGGAYDIIGAEVWVAECKQWVPMRKVFGAVWDMQNPPKGALNVRLQVSSSSGYEVKYVEMASVIPADWKAGFAYETSVQFT